MGAKVCIPKCGLVWGGASGQLHRLRARPPAIPAGCPQIWETHVTRAIAGFLIGTECPRIPGENEHCGPNFMMDKENRWWAKLPGPSSEMTSLHERCTRVSVHER